MPLIIPEAQGATFLTALQAAADRARAIRAQSGDLPFSELNALLADIARIRAAYPKVRQAAQSNLPAVEAYISSRGGPATWAEVEAGIATAATALNAFMSFLRTGLRNMTGAQLIDVVQRDFGGVSSEQIVVADFVPAVRADALRTSTQLANLIASLEALGATA